MSLDNVEPIVVNITCQADGRYVQNIKNAPEHVIITPEALLPDAVITLHAANGHVQYHVRQLTPEGMIVMDRMESDLAGS